MLEMVTALHARLVRLSTISLQMHDNRETIKKSNSILLQAEATSSAIVFKHASALVIRFHESSSLKIIPLLRFLCFYKMVQV